MNTAKRQNIDLKNSLTPGRSRGNNTTVGNNSSFYGEPVNADCIVAIVEGRGSARGEVGLASISLSRWFSVTRFDYNGA